MNGRGSGSNARSGFVTRPGDAESWVRAPENTIARNTGTAANTARLTIDVTPELRGRIKIAAFRRGVTVADMLRDLLSQSFPEDKGGTS